MHTPASSPAIWTYDFQTGQYDVNQQFVEYTSENLTTQIRATNILNAVHPEDRRAFKTALQKITSSHPRFRAACRLGCHDTAFGSYEMTGQLIFDPSGHPISIRTTVSPLKEIIYEILVAEDSDLNRMTVEILLEHSPYTPVFAFNGQEAVTLYKNNSGRFPLILMDVSMPVLNGYLATERIRAFEKRMKLPPCPIIALTGHAAPEDKQLCLRVGMSDVLVKPIRQADLMSKFTQFLGGPQAHKAAG